MAFPARIHAMIVEGLLTTVDEQGRVNVAPMGPIVRPDWSALVLRPFEGSQTLANLRATGRGVFHVVDDAELLARCAIGHRDPAPPMHWNEQARGWVLDRACRWYALEVQCWGGTPPRLEATSRVAACGRLRDFVGWNRARHAVLEAAILATRVAWLPQQQLAEALNFLAPLVYKTGDAAEHRAFALLVQYVEQQLGQTILQTDHAQRILAGCRRND